MKIYGVNDRFDIEVGMPVFEAGGQEIGLVTDIAGFGSTCVGGTESTDVIRASASTGHFGVAELLGSGPRHLRLRFADIHEVIPGRGVTLTEEGGASVKAQRDASDESITVAASESRRSPRGWFRSLWRRETAAAYADPRVPHGGGSSTA